MTRQEFVRLIKGLGYTWSRGCKTFSCLTQLSMKFSLLINMKMPTKVGIFVFISRKFSCFAMLSIKEFASVSNLRFISMTNFMLN